MSLHFIDGDITKLKTDAIVNAANNSLLGGGGVDGAIHRAAGPELLEECRRIGGLGTGKAVVTGGYALPAKYVIHTVGPVYRDGLHGEELLLRSAYRESLLKAAEISCRSLAFPVISSGAYGYPKEEAIRVAVSEISAFLLEHELEVFLVFYNESDRPSRDSAPDGLRRLLASLPDSREKARLSPLPPENRRKEQKKAAGMAPLSADEAARCAEKDLHFAAKADALYSFSGSIDNIGFILDESFQEMLLRLIDEKGMTDTECYKRANLDRKHFSKIRSNRLYQPKKATAAAFCIALRLSLAESEELLKKAGFALSDSTYFDRIIRYCIEHRIFDIDDVNLLLFKYDQIQLGAAVR